MRAWLLLSILALTSLQPPQANTGTIEGRITRAGTSEGIADVQVTLSGPSAVTSMASLGSLYTPNAALTPAMRERIDELLNSAPVTASAETVAGAAIRLEAQLLGLPLPANQNPATATQVRQTGIATTSDGTFTFRNLGPGRYQIRAQREGYFGPSVPGVQVIGGASQSVNLNATVTAGQPTPPISITMLRGAVIAGRVRDPNGQPLQSVQAGAYQITYDNGRKTLRQVASKQTDDRGEYRIYWLPPGDFVIAAVPRRSNAASSQDTYARTFYPGTVDGRSAQIVHIQEGEEVNGIDVLIRPDATAKISGRIATTLTAANGQPPFATNFVLFASDPTALLDQSSPNISNSVTNRNSGQFELRGIVPGLYELMASVPDGNGRVAWGRTRVNVTPGDNDVTLAIQPGVEVHARLTIDGAAPLYVMQPPPLTRGTSSTSPPPTATPTPNNRIQLRSVEGFGTNLPFENAANQNTSFDPSGEFIFRNVLEGRYTINVVPLPPNAYIADVKAGGTSVVDSGFDINSQTGEIQVFVNTNGGRVEGIVLDATRKPFSSARVALVPRESRRANIQLYKTSLSDTSGRFTMNGIAPGDYKLFAWEDVPGNAWMNAEYLTPFEGSSLAVTISPTASSPALAEVKLIPRSSDKR